MSLCFSWMTLKSQDWQCHGALFWPAFSQLIQLGAKHTSHNWCATSHGLDQRAPFSRNGVSVQPVQQSFHIAEHSHQLQFWFSQWKSKVEPAEISRHERSRNAKKRSSNHGENETSCCTSNAGMSSATKGTSFGIKPSFCFEASNESWLKLHEKNTTFKLYSGIL